MDSFFGADKSDVTGSIRPPPGAARADLPADADLTYARAAASELLRRNHKDASLDWIDSKSGARGTVTPIAASYVQDGVTCRDFLASYVAGERQAWLQGEACQQQKGAWEVRSLKPWKKTS